MNTPNIEPTPIKQSRSEFLLRLSQENLERAQKRLATVNQLAPKIDELDLDCSWYIDSLDFDRLSHVNIMRVILAFPGTWIKSPCEDLIHYTCKFDGYTIRCWMGEPPPSCVIEEYTVVEPSHYTPEQTVTKRRLVCPQNNAEV